MGGCQSIDAADEGFATLGNGRAIGKGQFGNGLDDGQGVANPVVQLSQHIAQTFFGLLQVTYIDDMTDKAILSVIKRSRQAVRNKVKTVA